MNYITAIIAALLLPLCVCVHAAQAEKLAIDPASPHYTNARYAFSLAWTPGAYSVQEADNGDGITVRDDRGLVMKAYGTLGYSVLGQDFDATLAELEGTFDAVTYKKVAQQGGWFVLSGYRGHNIGYLKCFFGAETAWIVDITYPRIHKDAYAPLVSRVAATFAIASGAQQ